MSSCVRQLDLSLSLPEALRADSWKVANALKVGFVSQVVECLEAELHQKYGSDAIIEIPSLLVRWACSVSDMENATHVEQQCQSIVDDILRENVFHRVGESAGVPSEDKIRVFRHRVHKTIFVLEGLTNQFKQSATAQVREELLGVWEALVDASPDEFTQIVHELASTLSGDDLLGVLSTSLLRSLLARHPLSSWPQAFQPVIEARLQEEKVDDADDPSCHSTNHDEYPLNDCFENQNTLESLTKLTGASSQDEIGRTPRTSGENVDSLNHDALMESSSSPRVVSDRRVTRLDDSLPTDNGKKVHSMKTARDSHRELVETDDQVTHSVSCTSTSRDVIDQTYRTRLGGLIYFYNLFLRWELPEIAWCCALDERSFLFDLLCAVGGPSTTSDGLVYALSGIDPSLDNYRADAVEDWAFDDIVSKLNRHYAAWAARSGFVHKANASYSLAVRQPRLTSTSARKILVKQIAKLAQQVLIDVTGTARVEDGSDDHLCTLPGQVRQNTETISLYLPLESVIVDLRRLALDIDPGYLPWRKRVVTIHYTERSA